MTCRKRVVSSYPTAGSRWNSARTSAPSKVMVGGADGGGAEVPAVRREQPGPAQHGARFEGLEDEVVVAGHLAVQDHLAVGDQPEPFGRRALVEDSVAGVEHRSAGRGDEQAQLVFGQAGQERLFGEHVDGGEQGASPSDR
jgi:hypothetical protein